MRLASAALEMRESSQVGDARRQAQRLAERIGFTAEDVARTSIVVTELANNLVRHARAGEIVLDVGTGALAIHAIDQGPGMDLQRCFDDGYSTAGTPGTGLGAVRRLARAFDAYSRPQGSVLYAQLGEPSSAHERVAAINVPLRGETACGDAWDARGDDDGVSMMLADGLGHGPLAEAASRQGLAALDAAGGRRVTDVLADAHARMRGSRGAACAVARVDRRRAHLSLASVGNISVSVSGREGSRSLPSQNGTVGTTLPSNVQQFDAALAPDDLVVMHTDGLSARWSIQDWPGLFTRHPAVVAGVLYQSHRRVRDDASVLVVRV